MYQGTAKQHTGYVFHGYTPLVPNEVRLAYYFIVQNVTETNTQCLFSLLTKLLTILAPPSPVMATNHLRPREYAPCLNPTRHGPWRYPGSKVVRRRCLVALSSPTQSHSVYWKRPVLSCFHYSHTHVCLINYAFSPKFFPQWYTFMHIEHVPLS